VLAFLAIIRASVAYSGPFKNGILPEEGMMGTRLLLADDSITIQKVVGIIFANEDYDLTVVDNGVSALEKASELVPDVMLVDALMPGRNGYEVCQEVRADARLAHIPLLLMTGAFEPFDEEKSQQCGADDFISKPFESQHLVDKVKKLIALGVERASSPAPPVEAVVAAEPVVGIEPASFVPAPEVDPWADVEAAPQPIIEPRAEMFDEPFSSFDVAAVEELPLETEGFAVEMVEALPGDDPWGVFDLSDTEDLPTASHDEIVQPQTAMMEEHFVFDAVSPEELPLSVELEEPPATFVPDGFDAKWEPMEEENYPFQSEEITPAGETFAVGMGEPLAMLSDEPAQYSQEVAPVESEPEVPVIASGLHVAPMLAEPAMPGLTESAAAALAAAAAVEKPSPQEPAPAVLGEEQLRAVLAQLSRETIEKIVWEIVPDLAETLIREEIRRLKAGVRD
jgi:CheY-like chemotaxis protein